jgi:hypothetical protein
MSRRDPFVHRRQDPHDREGASVSPRPNLAPEVTRLLKPDDPSPEGGGREGTDPILPGELGFEPLHLSKTRGTTLRGGPNRPHDPRFHRDPSQLRGRDPVAELANRHSEDLPSEQLDRASRTSPVLDGAADNPLFEEGGYRVTERPLRSVVDD